MYIYIYIHTQTHIGLPQWLSSKESICNAGDAVQSLGQKVSWRRVWQPTPVFLPGVPHGQRILVGYRPKRCKELDTPEATEHTACIYTHIVPVMLCNSCLILCDHMDCSPPGFFVHGISQAGMLECVAISFSKGSS